MLRDILQKFKNVKWIIASGGFGHEEVEDKEKLLNEAQALGLISAFEINIPAGTTWESGTHRKPGGGIEHKVKTYTVKALTVVFENKPMVEEAVHY